MSQEAIVTFKALTPGVYPNERILKLSSKNTSIPIGRASKSISKGLQGAKDNAWFDSPVMSREHAEIEFDTSSPEVIIRDVGSMHGTRLNGTALDPFESVILKHGDCLLFGAEVRRGAEVFPACCFQVTYELISSSLSGNTIKFPEASDVGDEESSDDGSDSEEDVNDDINGDSTPSVVVSIHSIDLTGEPDAAESFGFGQQTSGNHSDFGDGSINHGYIVPDSPVEYPSRIADSEDDSEGDSESFEIHGEDDEVEEEDTDENDSEVEGVEYPSDDQSNDGSNLDDGLFRSSAAFIYDNEEDDDADVIFTGIKSKNATDWSPDQVHDLEKDNDQGSTLPVASKGCLSTDQPIVIPDDAPSNSRELPAILTPTSDFDNQKEASATSSQMIATTDPIDHNMSSNHMFGLYIDREPSPSDAAMVKATTLPFSPVRPTLNPPAVNPALIQYGAPNANPDYYKSSVDSSSLDSKRSFLGSRRSGPGAVPRSTIRFYGFGPTHTPAWTKNPSPMDELVEDCAVPYSLGTPNGLSFSPGNVAKAPTDNAEYRPAMVAPSGASISPFPLHTRGLVESFSGNRVPPNTTPSVLHGTKPGVASSTGRVAVTINDIISTTPREIKTPVGPLSSKKRKAEEISDVLEEEVRVWASSSSSAQEPAVSTAPVASETATTTVTPETNAPTQHSSKRMKRFAEAVGYVTLGGVAVGASLFSLLVATAPEFI